MHPKCPIDKPFPKTFKGIYVKNLSDKCLNFNLLNKYLIFLLVFKKYSVFLKQIKYSLVVSKILYLLRQLFAKSAFIYSFKSTFVLIVLLFYIMPNK